MSAEARSAGSPRYGFSMAVKLAGSVAAVTAASLLVWALGSFAPPLSAGTLVAGQYEVKGALAHGGLGWIYLAVDRNVDDRWVVLKGLLDADAPDAVGIVDVEKRFLATVDHPGIVSIHNFVEHHDRAGNPMGFIVMEYVGGSSLKQIMEDRRHEDGTLDPLPVPQAIAYALEVLPALGYLHGQGLAYCDFKPDNVMQSDEQLKLIDLGATVAMDDDDAVIYGTRGYQAPEIARTGPTVATDVYTVGRTLAILVTDFPQTNGRASGQLPGPKEVPVFAQHESLYRAILRATDTDAAKRFPSMDELADQLTGVLHEIAAADSGNQQPRLSTHFSPQRAIYGAGWDVPLTVTSVIAAVGEQVDRDQEQHDARQEAPGPFLIVGNEVGLGEPPGIAQKIEPVWILIARHPCS